MRSVQSPRQRRRDPPRAVSQEADARDADRVAATGGAAKGASPTFATAGDAKPPDAAQIDAAQIDAAPTDAPPTDAPPPGAADIDAKPATALHAGAATDAREAAHVVELDDLDFHEHDDKWPRVYRVAFFVSFNVVAWWLIVWGALALFG
ncbi:MAG: hypothetical protein AAGC56_08450 [Pseudomonadota bacterium]